MLPLCMTATSRPSVGYFTALSFLYNNSLLHLQPDLIGSQFSWHHDLLKAKGSFFVGTSPEFEMAIYTICFLMKPNAACHIRLGGHSVSIQTYDNSNWSGQQIATAYPM